MSDVVNISSCAYIPTDADRELVTRFAGYGVPDCDIALLVGGGITEAELRICFDKEIRAGVAKAIAAISHVTYRKAIEGDVDCIKLWRESMSQSKSAGAKSNKLYVD